MMGHGLRTFRKTASNAQHLWNSWAL